jgi:hypothetical protein
MKAFGVAAARHPNLGEVESVIGTRAALVWVIAVSVLSQDADWLQGVGLLGAVLAVFMIGFGHPSRPSQDAEAPRGGWLAPAVLAAGSFALVVTFSRVATHSHLSPYSTACLTLGVGGAIAAWQTRRSRPRRDLVEQLGAESTRLTLAVVCASVGNAALVAAIDGAPNAAYPSAVGNLRMVALYAWAVGLGEARATRWGAVGAVLMALSASAIAF